MLLEAFLVGAASIGRLVYTDRRWLSSVVLGLAMSRVCRLRFRLVLRFRYTALIASPMAASMAPMLTARITSPVASVMLLADPCFAAIL